jgi:hypothetical protein
MYVTIRLLNDTNPKAEIHNINGRMWIDSKFLVKASQLMKMLKSPSEIEIKNMYLDFEIPTLQKKSIEEVVSLTLIPPTSNEVILINYHTMSSETAWESGEWKIINNNGKLELLHTIF